MCGIAGIYLKNKRVKVSQENIGMFCDRLLLEIEHRGKDATGYMAVGWNGSVKLDKAAKSASDFIKERETFPDKVQAVLLHTRFKTKGSQENMGNNHPVSYNNCFATHNGSISNDDSLFKDEELERRFEVDSEIIPALFDKHSLDTPETIREALEKLGGSFALAVMDPIRHPSRLVLAKGPISPLYVFENDNVIVWASEHKVIKDTWGDLVGTPPQPEKIKFVGEGKFLIADDYQDLGVYEFKVKPREYREHWGGYVNRGRVSRRRDTAVFFRPWDSEGPFNSLNDFKTALAHFRQNPPEGHTLARRWDLHDSYDENTDFADVEGVFQWPSCICGHGILSNDIVTHLKYGAICKDCYKVTELEWKKNGKKEPAALLKVEGVEIPEVAPVDWKNLDSWAEIESTLHRFTLAELSDQTGYSMRALDFLMHRTANKSGDFGKGMIALKFALIRAYEKLYEEITQNYWNEALSEAAAEEEITVKEAQVVANQQMYPWTAASVKHTGSDKFRVYYNCEVHNETFPYGDHCSSCVWEDDDTGWGSEDFRRGISQNQDECGVEIVKKGVVHPLTPDLLRCEECNAFYLSNTGCIPCTQEKERADTRAAEKLAGEVAEVVAVEETSLPEESPLPEVTTCCCKGTRKRPCKSKINLVVTNKLIGRPKGYCKRHWDVCNTSKCNGSANFTALDGYRYCHTHSRSRQGIADKAAHMDGSVSISEVK